MLGPGFEAWVAGLRIRGIFTHNTGEANRKHMEYKTPGLSTCIYIYISIRVCDD